MPTFAQETVKAYCHCRDARCPGYHQEEVDAVREEASYTFGENGGDGVFTHMIESSRVEYRFADDQDAPCPVCRTPREVTGEPRPQYVNESGHDPMGLLSVPKFDAKAEVPAGVRGETDEEIEARLRAKLREEAIEARLRAELD
jgi:hypothetical protein